MLAKVKGEHKTVSFGNMFIALRYVYAYVHKSAHAVPGAPVV